MIPTSPVCLTLNGAGSHVGVFQACGVTYLIALSPTDSTPTGWVLTITASTGGVTQIVFADPLSTCDAITFVGLVLACGVVNVTINNNALCCGSSSGPSEASTGAGGTLVVTDCCPDGVEQTIYAFFTLASPSCRGASLFGATVPLINTGGTTWTGSAAGTTVTVTCESGSWYMQLAGSCVAAKTQAASAKCPSTGKFSLSFNLVLSGCCVGTMKAAVG